MKEPLFNQTSKIPSQSGLDVVPPSSSILLPNVVPPSSSILLPNVQECESLNPDLQAVFPPDEKFSYVVEKFESKPCERFPGAPPFAFDCQVRINVRNEEEATEWLAKMQQHSSITYRITRTTKLQHCRSSIKNRTPLPTLSQTNDKETSDDSESSKVQEDKQATRGKTERQKDALPITTYAHCANTHQKTATSSRVQAICAHTHWHAKAYIHTQPPNHIGTCP